MRTALLPTPLPILDGPAEAADADWLVVPWLDQAPNDPATRFDAATGGQWRAARETGEWQGKRFELLTLGVVGGSVRARKIVVAGGGPLADWSPAVARRLASAVMIRARASRVRTLTFLLSVDGAGEREGTWVQAVAEGLTLGAFEVACYKTGDLARPAVNASIVVEGAGQPAASRLVTQAERGRLISHCANLARELVNEPGNALPPSVLADRARELASGTGLAVEVLDEREIERLGMGLVAAVGQGSGQPPRVIVLTHEPPDARPGVTLGLVGKGVTFDAGGISLKLADGMERMKDDMAGAATVVAAMRAISLMGIGVKVVAVVPSAENMPDGRALRPGDVIRAASGRTVEIVNTDAEGRLLLADALWYARERGATHLVDIATLTGSCTVALGKHTAGVFGRPDDWRDRVLDAARERGEPAWPLPLIEEEREHLESQIADTVNAGSRDAGAITAALFVGEFAGGLPWVHLDVAGPAWLTEGRPDAAKGPSGYGVRTLVTLAESLASR
jgi:leucyl aminopeptidase